MEWDAANDSGPAQARGSATISYISVTPSALQAPVFRDLGFRFPESELENQALSTPESSEHALNH